MGEKGGGGKRGGEGIDWKGVEKGNRVEGGLKGWKRVRGEGEENESE